MMAKHTALLLATLLVTSTAFAAIQSRAPQTLTDAERYALIVWAEGDAGAPRLAEVLEAQYGYRVLRQGSPTRESILEAFNDIYERISYARAQRAYSELVVYLSLPTVRDPNLFFAPPGGDPSEPWTLLDGAQLFEWLNALETDATLVFYPTCAATRSSYGDPDLEELTYAKRPGMLEMALVCAPDLDREAMMRQDQEKDVAPVRFWQSGEIAASIAESLERASLSGALEVAAADLVAQLPETIRLMDVRIQPIPRHLGSTFRFVPLGQSEGYRTRYMAATSIDELEEILDSFVTASAEQAAQPGATEAALDPLIEHLRDIARDGQALAPNAGLSGSEALRLRTWSVETLGDLDTPETRDALAAVATDAADSAVVRRRAVAAIARHKELRRQDKEALEAATGDPDASVREAAVRGLTLADSEVSADRMAEMLTNEQDADLRIALIQGLSAFARPQDRGIFEQILATGTVIERREAISALGRLEPSTQSNRALLRALQRDPDESVRAAAAYGLGRTLLNVDRNTVVESLLGALESGSERVAAAAASSLGRIGGRQAEEVLRSVVAIGLESEEPLERLVISALGALARMESSAALGEIEAAANHSSAGIRRAAVSALGQIGGERAVELLFASLKDSDPYVRGSAESALEEIEESVKDATVVRNVDSDSPRIRLTIVREFSGRDDQEAIDSLVGFLGDEDFDVRFAAARALSARNDPATAERVAELLVSGAPGAREAAAVVLGAMPLADEGLIIRALADATGDPVDGVRAEAIRGLGSRGDERVVELILRATEDRSEEVRLAAAQALGGFEGPEIDERLQLIAKEDPSRLVRRAAVESLSREEAMQSY